MFFFSRQGAHLFVAVLALFLLSNCARVPGRQVADNVPPRIATQELTEQELLNVSIRVFDPGILTEKQKEEQGLSKEIREAEARFVPIHLKYSMQRSGYWGAVRVVPDDDIGTDLLVRGGIAYSDGESGAIRVEVVDARNVVWFEKVYAETAKPYELDGIEPEREDIFQDLFNTVANDLVAFRQGLTAAEIEEIKQVAELRYAAEIAPDAFSGYLAQKEGRWQPVRLPARDDPMFKRVKALQVRDQMLIDTINGYYDGYYQDLWEPYANWRRFRRDEVVAMRKLEREALTRQLLGVASIVGAIAISTSGHAETRARTSTLRDVMIMGGAAAVYSGYKKGKESEINRDAIEELGQSFSSEAEPLVMQVEGETIRLTGSAEEQYARWRDLLRQMYMKETGFDLEVPAEMEKQGQQKPAVLENE